MNAYILNGLPAGGYFDNGGYGMQGTNQVMPMQGTNQVMPMQGTNQVVPMQGTNQVVPMQGMYGEYYVDPISLLDEDDVPLNGMPSDYTADDIRAYQLAYMMGDDDALNGLFSKVKSRIKERREGRAAQKEERRTTRSAKRASKTERRALRNERIKTGGTFLDKLGDVGGGLLKKVAGIGDELGEELDDLGVPFDDDILDQRALRMANEGIEPGDVSEPAAASEGGIMGFWNARSMPEKVAIGAGAAILGYLAYKQFSKRRK